MCLLSKLTVFIIKNWTHLSLQIWSIFLHKTTLLWQFYYAKNHCSQKKTIWEFLNQVRTDIKIVIFHKWNSAGLSLQPSNVLAHGAGNRCSRKSINIFSIKTPVCKASMGKDGALELQLNSRSSIQFLTSGTDGRKNLDFIKLVNLLNPDALKLNKIFQDLQFNLIICKNACIWLIQRFW